MPSVPIPGSLRARLIVAGILVQCVVLAFLLFNTSRIWNDMVAHNTDVRVNELSQLLQAALATPIANGDMAHTSDLLDALRGPEGIDYLVLLDKHHHITAARGWDVSQPLPAPTPPAAWQDLPPLIHVAVPIKYGNETLGTLRFGLSGQDTRDGIQKLILQNSLSMIFGMIVSAVLMALLGYWLTRHLYRLITAVETASRGQLSEIPVQAGSDEVARLTSRFNDMTVSIRANMLSLQLSEARYKAIAECTYGVELWLDPDGRLAWVNASVTPLTGYSVNECMMLGDFPFTLAMAEERGRLVQTLQAALKQPTSEADFEFRAVRRDGSLFWAALAWQPLRNAQGEYQGLRLSLRDNSALKEDRLALKKAVQELRQLQALGDSYLHRAEQERARLTALLAAMRFGVLFVDEHNRIVFYNPAFSDLWGLDALGNLDGKPIGQILQQADNRPDLGDLVIHYLEEIAPGEDRVDYGELTMHDGRAVTQQCYRVAGQHNHAGKMWVYEDVTQQRQMAERMINLAERDALTGLYNRHRFQQELERMVSEADRRQTAMALLFFDLDEFKYVNDTFGHAVGDELLKTIAKEIGLQVRRHEVLSRLGGDEFAILVPDCNEFEVGKLAERIAGAVLQIQFAVDGHQLRPSSSVGVAMFPQHATTPGELVAHADSAMYQAKAAGKATWRMYRPDADVSRSAFNRLSWKDRIMQALESDGFELHYQGIYDVNTRELEHLEALVRMKDVQNPGGVIMPGHFIPHAEKTGKIVDIDRWVIKRTVELLAARPDIPSVAINVSGRSFDEPALPEFIGSLLRLHCVDPRRLLVELTETAAVSDMRDAQRFIDALRATGCTVCLDDFGNGFASFAYLKQLKADVLKIDGFFIRDLPHDHDSQVFVRGIVAMARDMGKTTIAEFVENEAIYNMLVDIGVDLVQGYYLDKPTRDHPALRNAASA